VLVAWVAAFLLGTASPAAAHAEFVSSDPAPNSRLTEAPREITVRFNQNVSLLDGGFRLLDSRQQEFPLGEATIAGSEATVPLPTAPGEGAWVFVYRVISADSHPVAGSIPFTIGNVADTAAPVVEVASTDGTVKVLWWLDRWLNWAGLVLLLGVPAFVLFCWPFGDRDPLIRGLTGVGAAVVVLASVASLPLQAANATGAKLTDAFSDGSIPDLLERSAGESTLWRIGLALVVGVVMLLGRGRLALLLGLAASAGLLVTYSWAGHPAVADRPALTIADDALHLAAVVVWLGGLVVLALRLLPRPVPELSGVLQRWSGTATLAVIVLAVTGSIQAWRELQSVSAIVDTTYGRWVLAKVIGLIVLLALANLGRRWVRRHVAERSGQLPQLRRWVGAEILVATAVLAATAVLVVTTPGKGHTTHTPGPAAPAEHDHGHGPNMVSVDLPNQVRAEVKVEPAVVGTPTVTITLTSPTGGPVTAQEVTAYAALPIAGIADIALPLRREPDGRYLCDTTRFPFPGEWRITVTVRTSDVDSGVGTVSVHIQ
jgi:copper transport protein